jgi:hypothetical protein
MGNSVDTNLFIGSGTSVRGSWRAEGYSLGGYSTGARGATIRFRVPRETFVSLKVYSARGKAVAELAGRKFPAGEHTLELESGKLLKGVYFLSFKAGGFSANRKVILSVN